MLRSQYLGCPVSLAAYDSGYSDQMKGREENTPAGNVEAYLDGWNDASEDSQNAEDACDRW